MGQFKGYTVNMRALLVLLLVVACSSFRTLYRYGDHYDIDPYMNEAEDHDDVESSDDSDSDDDEYMEDRGGRQASLNTIQRPSGTCMQRCRRNHCHRRQCRRQCQPPCRQDCMSHCGPNCKESCFLKCKAKYDHICTRCQGCPPINEAQCHEMQQICRSQCRGPCNQDCDEDCRDHCRTDCRHECIDECNTMCRSQYCLLVFNSRNSTSLLSKGIGYGL